MLSKVLILLLSGSHARETMAIDMIDKRSLSSVQGSLIQALETVKTDIDGSILLYKTPAFQWEQSTIYRYTDLLESIKIMSTEGVAGKTFYIGEENENGHIYGLVNIAAFLAQSMKETIQYDACDENSVSTSRHCHIYLVCKDSEPNNIMIISIQSSGTW